MFKIREKNICGVSAVWHDSPSHGASALKPRPLCCEICGTATTKYQAGSTLWPATYKEDTIPKNKTFLFTDNTTINQNYESLEAWPFGQRMEDYQIAILKRNKNTTRGKRLNHYQMDYLVCNESSFSSVSLKYGGLITWLGAPEKGESKKYHKRGSANNMWVTYKETHWIQSKESLSENSMSDI